MRAFTFIFCVIPTVAACQAPAPPVAGTSASAADHAQKEVVVLPPFIDKYHRVTLTLTKAQPTSPDGHYTFVKVSREGDVELVDNFYGKEHLVVKRATTQFDKAWRYLPITVEEFDYRLQSVVLFWTTTDNQKAPDNAPSSLPPATSPAVQPKVPVPVTSDR
jgi:hypothetical protein